MVNVKPAGDPGHTPRQGARLAVPQAGRAAAPGVAAPGIATARTPSERVATQHHGRTSFAAGANPADTLRKAVRDLEAAGLGLAGEAATFVRSAVEELRSALSALHDNGDVVSDAGDAALRADLQRTQEEHGDDADEDSGRAAKKAR
jgi:hypothetical protein